MLHKEIDLIILRKSCKSDFQEKVEFVFSDRKSFDNCRINYYFFILKHKLIYTCFEFLEFLNVRNHHFKISGRGNKITKVWVGHNGLSLSELKKISLHWKYR